MRKKVVSIVGNGPLSKTEHQSIDESDIVIRFNLTPNIGDGEAKTTELFFACSSKQLGRYILNKDYLNHSAFLNANKIISTYHPKVITQYMKPISIWHRIKGLKGDWTDNCANLCKRFGKDFECLTLDEYLFACKELGISGSHKHYIPSSGFLVILHSLRKFPAKDYEINLFGFSFTGWKKHAWTLEKSYISRLHKNGSIRISSSRACRV